LTKTSTAAIRKALQATLTPSCLYRLQLSMSMGNQTTAQSPKEITDGKDKLNGRDILTKTVIGP
jgi:hypothetical protein